MNLVEPLNSIFKSTCCYDTINRDKKIRVRNIKNGVTLFDAIYYRFLYTNKDTTKDFITSKINEANNTMFSRQAFNSKENNIPLSCYQSIFEQIICLYNRQFKLSKLDDVILAVDGTNNHDNNHNIILNMGFYNVTNNLPIDLTFYGADNRNKEIRCLKQHILANKDKFNNVILVCDRGYFSYDLLSFLNDNNIRYIIRVKGNGFLLDSKTTVKKTDANYDIINKIKKEVRIIRYNNKIDRVIHDTTHKRIHKSYNITFINNCVLVTNLLDVNTYNNADILNKYKSRWDIETFFKFIKNNCKYQHLIEKFNEDAYKKMYYCELILTVITEMIINTFINSYKISDNIDYIKSVNKSNIIKGIYNSLLSDIVKGILTTDKLETFMRTFIKIIINKKNRSFPRVAKTPYTKWYVKGYADVTKFLKIIKAINEDKIDTLNKNLKMIYNRMLAINDVPIK